jgi:hypothetical protein
VSALLIPFKLEQGTQDCKEKLPPRIVRLLRESEPNAPTSAPDGTVLTFSAPLPLASDHSTDGHFAYRLESYEFGQLTRTLDSMSAVIPEPATGVLLAGIIVSLFCGGRRS